jgi:hypothetical protein
VLCVAVVSVKDGIENKSVRSDQANPKDKMVKHGADQLDEVHEIHIGAGGSGGGRKGLAGLSRVWHNVISDPALVYRDGQVREIPARADKELIWVPGVDEPMEVMSARHTEVLTLPRFIPGLRLATYNVGFFPKERPMTWSAPGRYRLNR